MAEEPRSQLRKAHTILGVAADAGIETIKHAYRQRVRTVHPDLETTRGTDGRDFMELRRAYEELLSARDPQLTRSKFEATTGEHRGRQSDLFQRIRPRRRTQASLNADLELDFLDALRGCERKVNFCVHNDWKGSVEVSIAPGTRHGTIIECREQLPFSLAQRGLQVRIRVKSDPRWRRSDRDLCMRVPMSLRTAYLGGVIEVASPWQRNLIQIEPGTNSQALRLTGQGVRSPGQPDGDLKVEVFVALPPHHNERLRLALMWAQPRQARRTASRATEGRMALAAAMPGLHGRIRRRVQARPSSRSGRGRLECELRWTPGLSLRPRQLQLELRRKNSSNTSKIDITMRAGLRHGQVVRLPRAVSGRDLHIHIRLEEDRRFEFVDSDIQIILPIDIIDTFTGSTIDVPTPDGWRSLKLTPGIQHGDRIKLAGSGLTDEDGRTGDVYFIVQSELPPTDDDYLAQILERPPHLEVEQLRSRPQTLALDTRGRRHRPKWRVSDLNRAKSGDKPHMHTFVRGRRSQ